MTDSPDLWLWPLQYGDTLSNHDWFEFHLHRFLTSRLVSHTIRAGRREDIATAVILWAECIRQDPAGTLPDDDVELAALARFATDLDAWRLARKWALHGWRPVVIGEAADAGRGEEPRLGHPFMAPIIARMHRRASSRAQGRDAARLAVNRSRVKKKLVDMHGGALTIRSRPGVGTQVRATIHADHVSLALPAAV